MPIMNEIWSEMQNHNCSWFDMNNSISSEWDVATAESCLPSWFIRTFTLLTAGIVLVIIVYCIRCFCCSGGCFRRRVYRLCYCCSCCCCCAISIPDTKAVENEVRRKWLRAIHTITDAEDPFPVNDPEVSQLLLFFDTYPGLRRLVGGRLVQYYAQPSAKPMKKGKHKRSHVVPV